MTPRRVAIFLCAGYGTRMRELGENLPKPLVNVAGRPMLDYLFEAVAALPEIQSVEIVTNHKFAAAFEAWAAEKTHPSLPVRVHDDGTTHPENRLGAVGDLLFLLERIGIPPGGALVASGDNIFLFSLEKFWRDYLEAGHTRVLALEERNVEVLRHTGVLELDGERVCRLTEKPAEPASTWACPSLYALDAGALSRVREYLESSPSRDEIGRFLGFLIATQVVEASQVRGERLHVGNPQELRHAESILARRAAQPLQAG